MKEGQEFKAEVIQGLNEVPYGAWRDGLFSCCKHGVGHVHLWLGFCFPWCMLGQIATRVGLFSSLARVTFGMSTFRMFFVATVVFCTADILSSCIQNAYADDGDDAASNNAIPTFPLVILSICQLVQCVLGIAGCVATIHTRQHVRDVYNIPATLPAEDVLCACCCSSCTICQMARHTTDYYKEDAEMCTETGLGADTMTTVIV